MVKEFQEGETYRNSKSDHDIMVLGVGKETKDEVVLAILKVDRDTQETFGGGELTVKKADFGDWTIVDYA